MAHEGDGVAVGFAFVVAAVGQAGQQRRTGGHDARHVPQRQAEPHVQHALLDHHAGGVAVHHVADLVRQHAQQSVVVQAFFGGRLHDAIGHHHLAAGQRKGVGAHARAELQAQRRCVAAIAVQRARGLLHQGVEPRLQLCLPLGR